MAQAEERAVPDRFSTAADGGARQLRSLEGFSIHLLGRPQQLVPLESLRHSHGRLVVSGELVPVSGGAGEGGGQAAAAGRLAVVTGAVLDWCLEYGDRPAIWAITEAAWYRLGAPAAAYASTFKSAQDRQQLALRCAAVLEAEPHAALEAAQQRVLAGGPAAGPAASSAAFSLQQLQAAAPFLSGQMATLQQSGRLKQPLASMPLAAWLRQLAAAEEEVHAAKRARLGDGTAGASAGAGPSSSKPGAMRLKLSLGAANGAANGGFKPNSKLKLKGQILPQVQPPPQDMGSQVQGHPPGGGKPKIKLLLPKGAPRPAGAGAGGAAAAGVLPPPRLEQQRSLESDAARAPLGPPPPHTQPSQPSPAPRGAAPAASAAAQAAGRQANAGGRAAGAAAARAQQAQRRREQQALELQAQQEAAEEADRGRGDPPPPTRSMRLPPGMVGDVLSLWELCQSFGGVLNVPPFSYECFEAALLPGPLTEQQRAQAAAAQAEDTAAEAAAAAAADTAAVALAGGVDELVAEVAADPDEAVWAAELLGAGEPSPCGASPSAVGDAATASQGGRGDVGGAALAAVKEEGGEPQHAQEDFQQLLRLFKDEDEDEPPQQQQQQQQQAPEQQQQQPGQQQQLPEQQQQPQQQQQQQPEQPPGQHAEQHAQALPQPPQQPAQQQPQPPEQLPQEQQPQEQQPQEQQQVGEPAESLRTQQEHSQVVPPPQQALPPPAQQPEQPPQPQSAEERQEPPVAGAPPPAAAQTADGGPLPREEAGSAPGGGAAGALAEQQQQQQQQQQLGEPAASQPGEAAAAAAAAAVATAAGGATPAAPAAVIKQEVQPPEGQQAPAQQQQQQSLQPAARELAPQLGASGAVKQELQPAAAPAAVVKQEQPEPAARAPAAAAELPPPAPRQQQHAQPKHEAQPTASAATTHGAPSSSAPGAGPSPAAKKPLKLKVKLGGGGLRGNGGSNQPGGGQAPAPSTRTTRPQAPAPAAAAAGSGTPAQEAPAAGGGGGGGGAREQQPGDGGSLEAEAAAVAAADDAAEDAVLPDVGLADRQDLPSSLLLRDIHSALLRAIDGSAPKPAKKLSKQPLAGHLCPFTGRRARENAVMQPHWSARVAAAISAAGGLEPATKQEALAQLSAADYAAMPLSARVAALRCLLDAALASESLRAHVDARLDLYSLARPPRPDALRTFGGTLSSAALGEHGGMWRLGASVAAAAPGGALGAPPEARAAASAACTGAKMVEEWVDWLAGVEHGSHGMRTPLGCDFRRRRYWVLGGASGAWRVFCEEPDGSQWGYYEGERLLQLARWLSRGGIASERPLLRAIATMPWPYRPALVLASAAQVYGPGGYGSYSSGVSLTPRDAGVKPLGDVLLEDSAGRQPQELRVPAPSQLMGAREMLRHRPDGYRGLVAPLLYGESTIAGGAYVGSSEARLRGGLASLVGATPFWLAGGGALLRDAGRLMEKAHVAGSPGEYTAVLLGLEAMLSRPGVSPPPLQPSWAASWQAAWRASLADSGPRSWEAVLLHLAMLGRHVIRGEFSSGRDSFIRTAMTGRCTIMFPGLGDDVVVLRTGALIHLDKYGKLPAAATAPLPPAAEELGAAAEAVRRLPPVSQYRVLAAAYCTYPLPEHLRRKQEELRRQREQQKQLLRLQRQAQRKGMPAREAAIVAAAALAALTGGGRGSDAGEGPARGSCPGGAASEQLPAASAGPGASDARGGSLADPGTEDGDEDGDGGSSLLALDGGDPHDHDDHGDDPHNHEQQPGAGGSGGGARAAGAGHQPPKGGKRPPLRREPKGPPDYRPPCMWALLGPVEPDAGAGAAAAASPKQQQQQEGSEQQQQQQQQQGSEQQQQQQQGEAGGYLALPFHIDAFLPDFAVNPELYRESGRAWRKGERFSMYVGGRKGQGFGGCYYKGTILCVEENEDPWQSITVLWDSSDETSQQKVSPWEIETDRDEARKAAAEERRRAEAEAAAEEQRRRAEAAAAAAAARAASGGGNAGQAAAAAALAAAEEERNPQRRRASRVIDYGELAGALDDDDDYNPLADDSDDSEGGGRGGRGRGRGRGAGAGVTWGVGRGGAGGRGGAKRQAEEWGPGTERPGKRGAGGLARLIASAAGVSGAQWTLAQVQQQQRAHLGLKQQQMLDAIASGNAALLAQLTAPPPLGLAGGVAEPFPTPLTAEGLSALPCREGFSSLVRDYSLTLRGKFTPPSWAGRELDLYSLFMQANVRGGYEAVCRTSRWGDVCRALALDGAPAAAAAMRTHYQNCLLEFEQYVRSGRWAADAAAGRPPKGQPEDTQEAIKQVTRAGAAAAAAPVAPPGGLAGLGAARPPQLLGVPGALGGMQALPGLPQAVMGRNAAGQPVMIPAAQLQALQLQLQLQQAQQKQQQQQQGQPGAVALPAMQVQQQLLLRQQLLQPGAVANPQLQALLKQQQVVAGAAPAPLAGGLMLQQLQQQQLLKAGGVAPPAAGPAAAPGAPGASANTQQALKGTGSINFTALLDDL